MHSIYKEMKYIANGAFFVALQKVSVVFRGIGLTWILVHLGSAALSAGALVLSTFSIFTYFLMGVLAAVCILASYAKGADKPEEIVKYVRHGLVFSLFLSIPMALVLLFFGPLFKILGQDPTVITNVSKYTQFLSWAIIPFALFVVLQEFFLSISKFYLTAFYSTLGVMIVLIMSGLLAFGKWGFPYLNISGLGLGALIGFSGVFAAEILHIIFSKDFKKYHFFSNWSRWDKKYFVEIWQIGWPIGAKSAVEIGIFAVIAILIGHKNVDELAAQQILLQIIFIVSIFSWSIDQAAMIRASQVMGSQHVLGVQQAGNAGLLLGVIIALFFAFVLFLFPQMITHIFFKQHTIEHPIAYFVIQAIPLVMIFQLFDSLRIISTGLLASLKDVKFAFGIEIISFWIIGLFIGFLFSRHYSAIASYWVGLTAGVLICSLTLLWRFYFKLRLLKTISYSTENS